MYLKKGDVVEGEVVDFASGGEGIIKIDRFPIFVSFAIVGETVRARVTFAKKDCAFAELVEIIEPSPKRVKPTCPYFGKCGGCDLLHISKDLQLALKRDAVQDALRKIAGIYVDVPLPIAGGSEGYRNKLSLPFAFNKVSGRVSLGFYERRSHKVVPIKWCAACGEWTADLISTITEWANDVHASVYDETTGKGLLRYAVARIIDSLSLTLVINGDEIPRFKELIYRLKEHFPDICVYVSVNKKRTNVIFGEDAKLVYGRELPQSLGRFYTVVSPKSFLQVNNDIRDKLYDSVAAALDGFSGEIVELYSGIGLLTAQLALRLNAKIVSVEIEPSAVRDAQTLINSLGVEDRVKCVRDDALDFMQKLSCEKCRRVLILDPPRKGCDGRVLQAAINAGFEKIIYISCNPQTLSRDAGILKAAYELNSVQPFDMFPGTAEVETLCVFDLKTADDKN